MTSKAHLNNRAVHTSLSLPFKMYKIYLFASHEVIFLQPPGRLPLQAVTRMSLCTDEDKFITRQSIHKLAETDAGQRSFHLSNTVNFLLRIHLLLVKRENADQIRILFNLTHSVLTPGCQGGVPTYRSRFLHVTVSC